MLPVLDASGCLAPNAARIFSAFSYFPKDPITAWAYIDSLARTGPEFSCFDQSAFFIWIESMLKRRSRSRVAAMMYANNLVNMKWMGREVSGRRSAALLSAMADAGHLKEYPIDQSNIRDSFNKFKEGVHLLLALNADETAAAAFGMDERSLRRILSLAFVYQCFIEENGLIPDWKPWRIDPRLYDGVGINFGGLSEIAEGFADKYAPNHDRKSKD